jgi:hypothetical protein
MGIFDRFRRKASKPAAGHSDETPPGVIFLGTARRPRRSYPEDMTAVRGTEDLPVRLTVGTLRDEDFARRDDGWTATYRGRHLGTEVVLRFERSQSGGRVILSEKWEGIQGPMSAIGKATWPVLWRQHAMGGIAEQWEACLKQRIEQHFVSWYLPASNEDTHLLHLPDGHGRTILVPVGFRDLKRLGEFLPILENAADVDAPVSAYLALTQCYVHYADELFPQAKVSDVALERYVSDQLGMLAVAPVRTQVGTDGSKVRTIRRVQYLLAISAFFRDIEAILRHLSAAGFVGRMDRKDELTTGERMAVILPPMKEYAGAKFKDATGDLRRFYEYPRFVDMEAYLAVMKGATQMPLSSATPAAQLPRVQAIGEMLLSTNNP